MFFVDEGNWSFSPSRLIAEYSLKRSGYIVRSNLPESLTSISIASDWPLSNGGSGSIAGCIPWDIFIQYPACGEDQPDSPRLNLGVKGPAISRALPHERFCRSAHDNPLVHRSRRFVSYGCEAITPAHRYERGLMRASTAVSTKSPHATSLPSGCTRNQILSPSVNIASSLVPCL
jgi:hypothetical protein